MQPLSFRKKFRSLEARSSRKKIRINSLKTEQSPMKNLMKTQMMATIKRAVKNNDIHYLIAERDRIRTEPPDNLDLIAKQNHLTLIEARKKHDSVKKDIFQRIKVVEKLKNESKKYQELEIQWQEKLGKAKKSKEDQLKNSDFILEELSQEKKVLKSMKTRLNEDKIFYQNCIIRCKEGLKNRKLQVNKLNSQKYMLLIERDNAEDLMIKLQQTFFQENLSRGFHLEKVTQAMEEKNMCEQAEKTRAQFENDTAEKALLAKNEEEISWNSLLHVHLFLKGLLKDKTEREMKKFSVVEKSFAKIKLESQIKTPEQLIDRFLNRNQIYGNLVGEVSRLKEIIRQLTLQDQQLQVQNQALGQKKQVLENIHYSKPQDQSEQIHMIFMLEKWIEKSNENQTIKKKVKQWLRKRLKMMRAHIHEQKNEKKFIAMNMKTFLNKLLSTLKEIEQDGMVDEIQTFNLIPINEKPVKLFQIDGSNEIGQNEAMEDDLQSIAAQREAILRKNSKFMKEVRVRYKTAKLFTSEKEARK